MEKEQITNSLIEIIRTDFFPGSEGNQINNETALISGGLMDSISTLRFVDLIEKKFGIRFSPHEVDKDNLDNVNRITEFICGKKGI